MRILLLAALLASVATPALAAPRDSRPSDQSNAEESNRRPERPARAERAEQPQRAERPERATPSVRVDRPVEVREVREARPDRSVQVREVREMREARPDRSLQVREVREMHEARPDRSVQVREIRPVRPNPDGNDGVRNWRPRQERVGTERPATVVQRVITRDDDARTPVQRRIERRVERRGDRDVIGDSRPPRVSRVPVEGTQPPLSVTTAHRDRDGDRTHRRDRYGDHRWIDNWRNDHRYDWRSHRNRHRSIFHLGIYFDPFGWHYRRYNVGWRLWPNYYSSRFWINDPWMYRLPYAPPGYRWIRYYDDAVLVDTWTGQVEDVIYNFFW